MTRLWQTFIAWTLSGMALPFLDRGAFGWWDKIWAVLFAVTAYAGIAGRSGIASARVCAGVVFVSFAAGIAGTKLAGLSALHFTPQAGPGVAGLFPLLLPLLLFAILSLSERAAAVIFPYSERIGHAGWTSLGFAVSVVNGAAFLATTRVWWAGNPVGGGWVGACAATALLAALAFGLSFVYPVD